jgi:glycosyltransferase involved in cell wall biosynthesis
MLVDFCLPAKNEELILQNSLEKLLAYCQQANWSFSWRIVGIINGSTDSSRAIFENFKQRFPTIVDFVEVAAPGRGGALKKYWLASQADVLVYMDSDLAVSLDNIPALVYPLVKDEQDLCVGSRLVKGANIKRSWSREIVSRTYILLSKTLLTYKVADLQCGFKGIRRAAFLKIYPFLLDNYWFFDTELIVLSGYLGLRIKEVPVNWQEHRFGQHTSTVKVFRDSWIFLRNLVAFRSRLRKIKVDLK